MPSLPTNMYVGPKMPVVLLPVITFRGTISPTAGSEYHASVEDAVFAAYTAPFGMNGDGVSSGIATPAPPPHAASASAARHAGRQRTARRATVLMAPPRGRSAS